MVFRHFFEGMRYRDSCLSTEAERYLIIRVIIALYFLLPQTPFNKGNGSLGLLASTLVLSSPFYSRTSLFLQKTVIPLKPNLKPVTDQWCLFGQRGFQGDGHCYLKIYINCQFHYTLIDLGKKNYLDSNDTWMLSCNLYPLGCCDHCFVLLCL